MLARTKIQSFRNVHFLRLGLAIAMIAISAGINGPLSAQFIIGNGRGAVGGVEINPNGVLNNKTIRLSDDLQQQLQQGLDSVDTDIQKTSLRMISLNALEKKIVECKNSGKPFPPSVMYMAGLQRIEYVIVSPDNNDIIIAGPGEGFKTDAQGNVVGEKSGMPVIHLEDFLVAMRHVNDARQGHGISVSIDPSDDGVRNVQNLMQNFTVSSFNQNSAKALEDACGPQQITLTGVPKDSRFSQVLVAVDYKMKRLAMGLEQAPDFLPSLLAMAKAKNSRVKTMSPRFWMEASYEPVAVSDDKTVWKLNGQGVCAKTEEEHMLKNGNKARKPNKLARTWAEKMTKQYDDLAKVQPVFRELRNLMDMSVVAAIVKREKLLQRVSLDIPAIQGADTISTPRWNVPQTVPTQCSYARWTQSLMVTTSGGVTVDSWSVAANTVSDSSLAKFSAHALDGQTDRWWWNARDLARN